MRFVFTVFRQFTKQNFELWKYRKCRQIWGLRPLHKSFPLNISSVNVTKSAAIPDLRNPTYFVRFNEEILMENFFFCALIFWSLCLINTLNAENVRQTQKMYVKRRKCQLRVTYIIFSSLQFLFFIFAEILVCATVFIMFFCGLGHLYWRNP